MTAVARINGAKTRASAHIQWMLYLEVVVVIVSVGQASRLLVVVVVRLQVREVCAVGLLPVGYVTSHTHHPASIQSSPTYVQNGMHGKGEDVHTGIRVGISWQMPLPDEYVRRKEKQLASPPGLTTEAVRAPQSVCMHST